MREENIQFLSNCDTCSLQTVLEAVFFYFSLIFMFPNIDKEFDTLDYAYDLHCQHIMVCLR